MQFEIYQGEKIEVSCNDKHFLRGEFQSSTRYHVKLFKDANLILEWALPTILLFRSVNIKYQNLSIPISSVNHKGLFRFELKYDENTISIRSRPLRKLYYFIYLNGEKIGEVFFPKKVTLGYRQFTLVTSTDNEIINLYVVLAFLLGLIPVL